MINGLDSALLSISMIGGFLLAAGGVAMMVRNRDFKRGGLMLVAALVLLANVLIWAL